MDTKIKVLVAEDNIDFANLLRSQIASEPDIQIVGLAVNGNQALEMIDVQKPDVVVLDIVMPNLDGIGVLEKLSAVKPEERPSFIVLTAIGQDVFIKRAIELGADYYIVKPFDIGILISRIRQVYKWNVKNPSHADRIPSISPAPKNVQEITDNDIEFEITSLLRNMGIPMHRCGYNYLVEAIVQTVSNNNFFGSITKTLYPSIAHKYNTTPQKVERSIRSAIENVWVEGNQKFITSLFGSSVLSRNRPTNSEFIAMLADRARLNLEKTNKNFKNFKSPVD